MIYLRFRDRFIKFTSLGVFQYFFNQEVTISIHLYEDFCTIEFNFCGTARQMSEKYGGVVALVNEFGFFPKKSEVNNSFSLLERF
jgi:hypothetical protein